MSRAVNVVELRPNDRLSAALSYARRGWAVLPCKGKSPLSANGVTNATSEASTIEGWWRKWPNANVGIATGDASGIVVLDIDTRHGGTVSLEKLQLQYGTLPPTYTVRSGAGGFHYYFQATGLRSKKIEPGVDFQSTGYYVVAPPSIHPTTHAAYEIISDIAPAELPAWLAEKVGRRRATQTITHGAEEELPELGEGERNAGLSKIAGFMRKRGMRRQAILAALLAENMERCRPPLPEGEVEIIVDSVMRYSSSPTNGEHLSDLGNARRMAIVHGARIRNAAGEWLIWDNQHWVPDDGGEITQLAADTVSLIYNEALKEAEDEDRERLLKWALRSESKQALQSMVDLVATEPGISISVDMLDSMDGVIVFPNGSVR